MNSKNKLLEKIQKTSKKHRIIASVIAVLLIGGGLLVGSTQASATTTAVPTTQRMYRLYNLHSGEHFYTANKAERDSLVLKSKWYYEGVGWIAPTHSNTPVYRLYNKNAGDHHYTINKNEKDMLVKKGWIYEGIGWYSDDKKTIKVLRAYNKNAKSGSHNYTTSNAEQQNLIKNGWRNEGIGWYAAGTGIGIEQLRYEKDEKGVFTSENQIINESEDIKRFYLDTIILQGKKEGKYYDFSAIHYYKTQEEVNYANLVNSLLEQRKNEIEQYGHELPSTKYIPSITQQLNELYAKYPQYRNLKPVK
ncbi:hypothetical protein [Pseudolactococcus insecticola]|uniref:DUF5648 domain-containing protein n=1 Tax=Pseudolactococcus insecticola TaxID=2709158 RepID=A0A6A0BA00_9LACT|nr:hypothetical protein [Lactococcus insecticola]GFH41281.1 hypothetical protein Hs20B_16790 [Lactococcus insecticola]